MDILDCMEVFSKGIDRALVPMGSQVENVAGVELLESASCYQMITQMDLLKFLKEKDSDELQAIMSRSVTELGPMGGHVFGVTDRTRVIDAINYIRAASLLAVPVVEASKTSDECHNTIIDGKGRKLVGTFSATDLRGCPISQLRSWLPVEPKRKMSREEQQFSKAGNPSYGRNYGGGDVGTRKQFHAILRESC
ncbi:SNF1-related protein kinase regulatory subunit gamma-like PV42a isoform X2 [Apium graveolens]|uniref:SNF1-related protein kinase regulatory subunit gamma-like PV42a isoform X2 n=1 Tax=Apium graveolens TaxID=4045 RepID=UPI003D79FCBF